MLPAETNERNTDCYRPGIIDTAVRLQPRVSLGGVSAVVEDHHSCGKLGAHLRLSIKTLNMLTYWL